MDLLFQCPMEDITDDGHDFNERILSRHPTIYWKKTIFRRQ